MTNILQRIADLLCPWWVIRRQKRIIDELVDKAEHLSGILANPSVMGMKAAKQQLQMGLKGPICEYMAAVLGGLVAGCPEAENYLELDMQSRDGRFLVTVTRPGGGQTPDQLRMQAEAEVARLREQLEQISQSNTLAQQAMEVLEALADMANDGEPDQPVLTIASDWGLGSATLIAPNGSHTHVGGDDGETREENLALFIQGMHQQLVQGRGLSWVAPTTAPPEVQADV